MKAILLGTAVLIGLLWSGDTARADAKALHSMLNMRQIVEACIRYAAHHEGNWPDRLDQLTEQLGGEAGLKRTLENPVTGDNPGYEYVKPHRAMQLSTQVVLFQKRKGSRDSKMAVGYGDASIRPMDR